MNDPEIVALSTISSALADLEPEARGRVLRWVAEKHGVQLSGTQALQQQALDDPSAGADPLRVDQFGEFFAQADPTTDVQRALLAAAWLSRDERREFQAADVNGLLKDLGYPVGNITDALDSLRERRPAFVLQTKKAGTSRQARKTYKLSDAGLAEARRMASGESTSQ